MCPRCPLATDQRFWHQFSTYVAQYDAFSQHPAHELRSREIQDYTGRSAEAMDSPGNKSGTRPAIGRSWSSGQLPGLNAQDDSIRSQYVHAGVTKMDPSAMPPGVGSQRSMPELSPAYDPTGVGPWGNEISRTPTSSVPPSDQELFARLSSVQTQLTTNCCERGCGEEAAKEMQGCDEGRVSVEENDGRHRKSPSRQVVQLDSPFTSFKHTHPSPLASSAGPGRAQEAQEAAQERIVPRRVSSDSFSRGVGRGNVFQRKASAWIQTQKGGGGAEPVPEAGQIVSSPIRDLLLAPHAGTEERGNAASVRQEGRGGMGNGGQVDLEACLCHTSAPAPVVLPEEGEVGQA